MKDFYVVHSERYHRLHKFVKLENGNYKFVPEEDWMPLYVTMNSDSDTVKFIDTEGGPCIDPGFRTDEFRVVEILNMPDGDLQFVLKEI